MSLTVNQTGIAQQLKVVRDSRLFDRQRRLQVADTHLARAACQHCQDLDADRIRQCQQGIAELLCGLRAQLLLLALASTARAWLSRD